jgi:hypothetical protein
MSTSASSFTLEHLLRLHGVTKGISSLCSRQLRAHLDTLAPLFRPRRILGDYMEGVGKEPVAGSERTWTELQDLYRRVAVRPFDLRPELPNPLESLSSSLQLHEWEYTHSIQTERGWQAVQVTSPLTWVIGYSTSYSPGSLRQRVQQNAHQKDLETVRAFVLRACILHLLFQKHPPLTALLTSLRYRVEVRTSKNLGELPLVTVSLPFNTVRPSDEMVTRAAGFAGGDHFTEVIDLDGVRELQDPLREEVAQILKQHGESL